MSSEGIVGQILDGKYSIESQLGKGGMGTVYLSTHIGTGRQVAVKVIAPEFMKRTEFVERFRREAKAAGRLRHPNVVDVTDFGFSQIENGEDVAYLVMEYLDGCTLGEVLDEEKKLPVEFSIDILEQVCSAVEEAHKQGIIHRDLKPDNIWLEPNQRGGYTVKVLDFGIAKLEETQIATLDQGVQIPFVGASDTAISVQKQTLSDTDSETVADSEKGSSRFISENETKVLYKESKTIIQPIQSKSSDDLSLEKNTSILPANQKLVKEDRDLKGAKIITDENEDTKSTKIISARESSQESLQHGNSSQNLTRIGAVLGTPLYMSPEQCRGEKLTPRSDIYSLAVIAYQMLSGNLPFTGDYVKVMKGHKSEKPPDFKNKKVPKKLKAIVMKSLSKKPENRPMSADSFASKLRANSEGIGVLLRRGLVIYSKNLPKILLLTSLTFLPLLILAVIKTGFYTIVAFDYINDGFLGILFSAILELLYFFLSIVTSAFLVGMMTWLVAQYLAFPLRPLSLASAFDEVKSKAKSLSFTVSLSTILALLGFLFFIIPGFWLSAKFMLIAPSIMMENVKGKSAFKRSLQLTKRSFRTVLAISLLVYMIPMFIGASIAVFATLANTTFIQSLHVNELNEKITKMERDGVTPKTESLSETEVNFVVSNKGIRLGKGTGKAINLSEESESKIKKFHAMSEIVSQTLIIFIILLIASFTSVITALLYFKTRQAGGESMQDLLGKLDDADQPQSKWQQRVRERLILSGKITASTTTNPSKS